MKLSLKNSLILAFTLVSSLALAQKQIINVCSNSKITKEKGLTL